MNRHACFLISVLITLSLCITSPGSTAPGDTQPSIEALKQAVAKTPKDPVAHFRLGKALLNSGDVRGAAATFARVLELKPSSVESRMLYAQALTQAGRWSLAKRQYERLLKDNPKLTAASEALKNLDTIAAEVYANAWQNPTDETPQPSRLALIPGPFGIEPGEVDLLSAKVYDYTFSDAPSDWVVRSGQWAITNRWTCSPEWSWQGGQATQGIASLWNKRVFEGDVTVEAYCGFKMGLGQSNNYRNPSDLNITIHGDGANPDSGYSFIIGATRNTESRIMRGTTVIARSSAPEALLPIFEDKFPDTYDFHRRWWSLRARKHGDLLQLYLDNKLIVEANDPEPLTMGRVALWTYDNGILVSRIKIYSTSEVKRRPTVPGVEQSVTPVSLTDAGVTTPPRPPFSMTSLSHPGLWCNFESSTGPMSPAPVLVNPAEINPAWVTRPDGKCARIVNPQPGGTFSTKIMPGVFKLQDYSRIAFDYCLPASNSVKLSLYLTVADRLCEIGFSGPEQGTPAAVQLGRIADVVADGQWHRAEFDILGAVIAQLGSTSLTARDLVLANLNETDYLLAGFGGNRLGDTLLLDNLSLTTPRGKQVKVAFNPNGDVQIAGYAVQLSPIQGASLPQSITTKDLTCFLEAAQDGTGYIIAAAQLPDGSWSEPVTQCIAVDTTPPALISVNPPTDTILTDGPVRVQVSDPGGSGLDLSALKLTLNKQPVANSNYSWDAWQQTITLSPAAFPQSLIDGSKVELTIEDLKDRAGNLAKTTERLTWQINYAADETPPPAPHLVIGPGALVDNNFEATTGEFSGYGGNGAAVVSLSSITAYEGKQCLQVHNPTGGGRFGLSCRKAPFDAGRNRIVRFAYKIPPRLRADLAVYVNGDWKAIRFMDNDCALGHIGSVPDVRADNQWHIAEFNLYDMLRRDDPNAPSYLVRQFVIADWNWSANAPGQTYYLDNFQILPVISARESLPISWTAPDVSGIKGINWQTGVEPVNELSDEIKIPGLSGLLQGINEFSGWLSARCQDGAGNWSPVTSMRLLVDSTIPRAATPAPAQDTHSAPKYIEMSLMDQGIAGIDPASINLSVNGVDYTLENTGLRYNSDTGRLTWDCESITPEPVVFTDGQTVPVQLAMAQDFAGNKLEAPLKWSWVMDYSLDKDAPLLTRLTSATHPTALTETFEAGVGGIRSLGGDTAARVDLDTSTSASGKASVRFTQQTDNGNIGAWITQQPFTAENSPFLSFDYRIPGNVKLDLVVRMVNGTEYPVSLTDNPTGAIGRIAGIKADNTWRHASVDLAALIRQKQQNGSLQVSGVYLIDRGRLENKKNAQVWFDNIVIAKIGSGTPVVKWRATDPTGIRGYSYILDQEPDTVPGETITTTERSGKLEKLKKGRWYFHIRACDGAGNWGPPSHYAMLHLTAD